MEDLIRCELRDNGKFYFLIKWDGYSDEDNTMEPYENITSPMFRYRLNSGDAPPLFLIHTCIELNVLCVWNLRRRRHL